MSISQSGKYLVLIIVLLLPALLFCQEYNYINYDVKDGLAGSTVYSAVQDKDGFMWFGTETGLSRFDGTNFKNFYTSDGLPDNEIIHLFVDSKNRVWIMPFKSSTCYYWKGKIHNQENDTLLQKLKFSNEPLSVSEDKSGNIIIADKHALFVISQHEKSMALKVLKKDDAIIIRIGFDKTGNLISEVERKDFDYMMTEVYFQRKAFDSIFMLGHTYNCAYISPRLMIYNMKNLFHLVYNDHENFKLQFPEGFIDISEINDSILSFNTVNKSYLFNINAKKMIDTFLIRQTVNDVKEDTEGNLWFAVSGKGVYRLASGTFLNFSSGQQNKSIFSIQKFDSLIYAGSDDFHLCILNINKRIFSSTKIIASETRGRITALIKDNEGNIVVGSDEGIFLFDPLLHAVKETFTSLAIKSLSLEPDKKIIVSASRSVIKINGPSLRDETLVWDGRATCAFEKNNVYYIGTLLGLFTVDSNRKISYLGDSNAIFKSRINAIGKSSDGALWIATNGSGLVQYKNNKIISTITEANGLTSNICRNIFIAKNIIWVGTDKGLNKISYSDGIKNIISFTSSDGLNSDIINAVYASGDDMYVGTPEGLTYFNNTQVSKKSICNLRLTSINVSGFSLPTDTSSFISQHNNNNIEFQYVGISYKSGGKITYQYRLIGLDTNWQSSNKTSLNYTLPSGKYELQLKAINKFGVKSDLIKVQFEIAKTIWEKNWFKAFIIIAMATFLWLAINYRIRAIRKKEAENSESVRRIAELEQMALKSQMNPHFIFNCLNSIQHYVIDKDIVGANEFISNFSRLIRLTLDNSSKTDISIADEISYISAYLQLEQKRFEDKFDFEIISDPEVNNDYFIPSMILQPYVENAIRHGIRYRDDKKGKIIIKFEKNGEYMICTVSDNGIGRKLSFQLKSKNPIEYQSKGMQLTASRIDMFNKIHPSKIIIQIHDLEDEQNNPLGTEVAIYFPLVEIQKDKSRT